MRRVCRRRTTISRQHAWNASGRSLSPDTGRVDTQRISLENPHWPLVFMLVLTQLAAGVFAHGRARRDWQVVLGSRHRRCCRSVWQGLSLGASTLHLGRPVYAWRALRGLRTSWLSREVLALSLFAGAASVYSAMLLSDVPGRIPIGLATALLGIAGVTCSARIYIVKARPAWFSSFTLAEFFATGLLLGPLFVRAIGVYDAPWLGAIAATGGAAQLVTQTLKFLWLSRSDQFELRASSLLLGGRYDRYSLRGWAVPIATGIVAPLMAPAGLASAAVFVVALLAEWSGRWLFFVSVVPKNMAAAFSGRPGAAI